MSNMFLFPVNEKHHFDKTSEWKENSAVDFLISNGITGVPCLHNDCQVTWGLRSRLTFVLTFAKPNTPLTINKKKTFHFIYVWISVSTKSHIQ